MPVGATVINKGTYVYNISPSGVSFNQAFTFKSNGETFESMIVADNFIQYGSTIVFEYGWVSEAYKTVIVESDQEVNIEFGVWFVNSFTLQAEEPSTPSITDLTGTTWNVPSGWTATAGYGQFNISGVIDGTMEFSAFYIGYGFGAFDVEPVADTIHSSYGGDIKPSSDFTLAITGGTDATNTSLISWLEANGTLQEEPTTGSVTITYGERTITLTAGQKCTFKGGKVMQADIVATVSASEEVTLISFTISGTTYYSPEGWTWEQWVADTTYNTDGYYVENTHIISPDGAYIVVNQAYEYVESTYLIRADGVYLYSTGGSN